MSRELRLGETFLLISRAVYRYRLFLLRAEDLLFYPGEEPGSWCIGRLARPEESRVATNREVGHYMGLLAPQLTADEARQRFWVDLRDLWADGARPSFHRLLREEGEPVLGIPTLSGRLNGAAERPAS